MLMRLVLETDYHPAVKAFYMNLIGLFFISIVFTIYMAKLIQKKVQSLKIAHSSSEISDIVTISIGIATIFPSSDVQPKDLIHLEILLCILRRRKEEIRFQFHNA